VIQVELSHEEQLLLRELLEVQHSELRMEIAGTDRLEYRDLLRERKAVLIKVLDVLAKKEPSPS
jgi:hypothetical protein